MESHTLRLDAGARSARGVHAWLRSSSPGFDTQGSDRLQGEHGARRCAGTYPIRGVRARRQWSTTMPDLIQMVMNAVPAGASSTLAGLTGESPAAATSGIAAAIP